MTKIQKKISHHHLTIKSTKPIFLCYSPPSSFLLLSSLQYSIINIKRINGKLCAHERFFLHHHISIGTMYTMCIVQPPTIEKGLFYQYTTMCGFHIFLLQSHFEISLQLVSVLRTSFYSNFNFAPLSLFKNKLFAIRFKIKIKIINNKSVIKVL